MESRTAAFNGLHQGPGGGYWCPGCSRNMGTSPSHVKNGPECEKNQTADLRYEKRRWDND